MGYSFIHSKQRSVDQVLTAGPLFCDEEWQLKYSRDPMSEITRLDNIPEGLRQNDIPRPYIILHNMLDDLVWVLYGISELSREPVGFH